MMEFYYEEEYEAATPLIASILWGKQSERSQIVQQLETLNTQISAKNTAQNLPSDESLIIIPAFSIAADIFKEASLQLLNFRDIAKFNEVESTSIALLTNINFLLSGRLIGINF